MTLSASSQSRQSELDRIIGSVEPSLGLADELFGVADTLEASAALRRALTDPAANVPARAGLVRELFGNKVSEAGLRVVESASGLSWPGGLALAAAIERQGVRVVLSIANTGDRLSEVENQLFRFGRVVETSDKLRAALSDQRVPAANRQGLVRDLLQGKALDETVRLCERAVLAKDRTFALTVEHYLALAAALRNREVAVVRVARELDAEQADRLRASLAKLAGREVNLEVVVDPVVQGGLRVEWADEVIEGTVAGRLEDARRQLT